VLKHLKKPLTSASPHQQLLALTVLEACTKNCGPGFHQKLAFSDVWAVVQMMATKTGTEREVQNKSLELIEDWAHGLSFPSFRDCYDGLKAKGVVFPPHDVATPNDFAMADPEPLSAAGDALAQHVPEGVSEEDRLAIEAAMAEFASEGQGQPAAAGGQDTGNYVPPSFVEQGQEPPPPPPAAPAPARQPAPYTGPSLSVDQPTERLLEDIKAAKQLVSLLDEMLKAVPESNPAEVLQEHVREVADQVAAMQPRLQRVAEAAGDSEVLVATLELSEELHAVQMRHDGLMAAAAGGGPQQRQPQREQPAPAAGAAAPGAAPAIPPPPPQGKPREEGPLINLMDDEPSQGVSSGSGEASDPFLPVSTQPEAQEAETADELAASFDRMMGDGADSGAEKEAAPQDAAEFDALTESIAPARSGPSNYPGLGGPAGPEAAAPDGAAGKGKSAMSAAEP